MRHTKTPTCPECGSEFDIQLDVVMEEPVMTTCMVRGRELPRRTSVVPAVAFCTGCEVVVVITVPTGCTLDLSTVGLGR